MDIPHADCLVITAAGQTFAMRASLPEPGAMRFVHTQPGTGNCAPQELPLPPELPVEDTAGANVWWVLEQALPTSQGFAGYVEVEILSSEIWARPLDEVLDTCIAHFRSVV